MFEASVPVPAALQVRHARPLSLTDLLLPLVLPSTPTLPSAFAAAASASPAPAAASAAAGQGDGEFGPAAAAFARLVRGL